MEKFWKWSIVVDVITVPFLLWYLAPSLYGATFDTYSYSAYSVSRFMPDEMMSMMRWFVHIFFILNAVRFVKCAGIYFAKIDGINVKKVIYIVLSLVMATLFQLTEEVKDECCWDSNYENESDFTIGSDKSS